MENSTPKNPGQLRNKNNQQTKQRLRRVTEIAGIVLFAAILMIDVSSEEQSLNDVFFSLNNPEEIVIGMGEHRLELEYLNISGFSLTNQEIKVELPQGASYIPSSLSDLANLNLREKDISNLNTPLFVLDDLPDGSKANFSIAYKLGVQAVSQLTGGKPLISFVELSTNEGTAREEMEFSNVSYPVLGLSSPDPALLKIKVGDAKKRKLLVSNNGDGSLQSFFLSSKRSEALSISSLSTGTLNASQDTLYFSAEDFKDIGNGNAYLDPGESITVIQALSLNACGGQDITFTLAAGWGSPGDYIINAQEELKVLADIREPKLKLIPFSSKPICFGPGNPQSHGLTIMNNGEGFASSLELEIFKSSSKGYDDRIFSSIDESSIQYKTGNSSEWQSLASISSTASSTEGAYACLGKKSTGKISLKLADLLPGDSLSVRWNSISCCVDLSAGQRNTGWGYALDYKNICATNSYQESGTGEKPLSAEISIISETPTDVAHGQKANFSYSIDKASNEFAEEAGASYQVSFLIPQGLEFSGKEEDMSFRKGTKVWSPSSFDYQSSSRRLNLEYKLPSPFDLPQSELNLALTADGSGIPEGGNLFLDLSIAYTPSEACGDACAISLYSSSTNRITKSGGEGPKGTKLHKSAIPTEGLAFNTFAVNRSSFGLADNDQDGDADDSGSLDMSQIKLNRAFLGDEVQASFRGVVYSASSANWDYAYAETRVEADSSLSFSRANLRIFDASSASYLSCSQIEANTSFEGGDKLFLFDLSPSTLSTVCSSFSSYSYEDGDSIWLEVDYIVSENVGGKVKEVDFANELYLSNIASPSDEADKITNDSWSGKINLLGYYLENGSLDSLQISNCADYISQRFRMKVGSSFAGGDLFPYEYRNFSFTKQAVIKLPDNYEVLGAYLEHYITIAGGNIDTQRLENLTVDVVDGNAYTYDLSQYYESKGGSLKLSDEGFEDILYVQIAPNNSANTEIFEAISWEADFGATGSWCSYSPEYKLGQDDKVKYIPAALGITNTETNIQALTEVSSWNLDLSNTSTSGAQNAWLHFYAPNGDVSILRVIDTETGDTLKLSGDIYQIGEIEGNTNKSLQLDFSTFACSNTDLKAFMAFECSNYPSTFADFEGGYDSASFIIEPQLAALSGKIRKSGARVVCGNELSISLEVSNTLAGNAQAMQIEIDPSAGSSISLKAGSAKISYPSTSSYAPIPDPVVSNGKVLIELESLLPSLFPDGLPGSSVSGDSNAFKILLSLEASGQFSSTDPLSATISSSSACGQSMTPLTLNYEADFSLTNVAIENLTTDVGNNWGASWADFNGDGYEDVFVPEFNHWSGSKLYINDGSGGFSPSSVAGAPIQDKGAAAGSSWGDYDNDGDMDLFVSNNVRAVNHLYQNNGDGTFSRRDSADIGAMGHYAGYCHNAAWIDYDNDGYLDLFVSDFMPTRYNQLYHNEGDGTFSRATDNPIAMEAKFSMGATWADYDGDGLLDLFVPNGRDDNNSLYHNEGNGQFTKIATGDIVNDGGNSTGSSWADFDNDGDMDLYVTNASNQKNFFYINKGDGTFRRNYDQIIVQERGHSHGSVWADLDKDGDLDLIVGNDNGNENYIYKNNGDATFSKSEVVAGDADNTMGITTVDYDLDGDLDIFMANNRQLSNTLYRNDIDPCLSYKGIQLQGERSNKSAVGARIRVKANIYGKDVWQSRQINTQSGGGASGQSSIRAYFGLGDASIIDSVVIDWPSGFEQTLTHVSVNDVQTIIEEDGAEICGTVFYDMNENCVQDPNEPGVPNILLEVYPGPKYVTTNDQGEYKIYRQYGTYTINSISTAEWSNVTSCDSSHSIVYNSANKQSSLSFCGKDFAMTPSCSKPDLLTYLSSTALRRGFQNSYAISYLNRGALAANNLELVVEFDNDIIPLSADVAWDAMTPGPTVTEYVWNISSLNPMEQATIMITDSVSAVAEMGKMAEVRAYFRNPPDDCDLSNNLTIDYNEVVGAVDPNDILVWPKGSVLDTDTLTYKIRFQNVGNKFAQNVIIRDTLSPYLKLASIEVETASHDFRYEISEDRVLSFFFDRIFLPDSTSNEAASHGFVQYKIKPGEGVLLGTIIENRAAIQFDFNEYIITNTVKNQVVNALSLAEESQLELKVSPNPLIDESFAELHHKTESGIRVNIEKLEVYNTLGNLVHVISKVDQPRVAIRKNHLPSGVFVVKAYDKNGFSYSQKIEVR